MKTNIITKIVAILAVGIAIPAMAASNSADKPEVKILFRHTAEAPYDVRLLSWCGGLASRVQIVPTTDKTIVVAYNTGDLQGAKITGRAPSRIGFRVCKAGKTTTLFDLLSLEKNTLPNLVTRLSDTNEWRTALALQNHGALNIASFAHTPLSRDQYAYSPLPILAAR